MTSDLVTGTASMSQAYTLTSTMRRVEKTAKTRSDVNKVGSCTLIQFVLIPLLSRLSVKAMNQ